PDSQGLLVVGDEARLWDLRSGKLSRQWFDGRYSLPLAFTPDGKNLALGYHGLAVFDVKSGEFLRNLHGQRNYLTPVAYSPDGKLLATACQDGSVLLREASSGQERLRWPAHGGGVKALAFTPDSKRLATGCTDGTALLWGLEALEVCSRDAKRL